MHSSSAQSRNNQQNGLPTTTTTQLLLASAFAAAPLPDDDNDDIPEIGDVVRWGIIGAGAVAEDFAKAVEYTPGAEVGRYLNFD